MSYLTFSGTITRGWTQHPCLPSGHYLTQVQESMGRALHLPSGTLKRESLGERRVRRVTKNPCLKSSSMDLTLKYSQIGIACQTHLIQQLRTGFSSEITLRYRSCRV